MLDGAGARGRLCPSLAGLDTLVRFQHGDVAQMEERLFCKQDVGSSILPISTNTAGWLSLA